MTLNNPGTGLGLVGGFDRDGARDEVVAHLSRMIQIDTSNPPGNELLLARYIHGVLSGAGIECTLFEPAPQRGAIVARIAGNGSAPPVMLLAHMDVVGAVREQWSIDPFGGVVKDGYVYGRGAIDDKGMLAANLMTMLLLERALDAGSAPLTRDVLFVATSDEETGGEHGLGWLLEHHPELLRAEFALNEGGRVRIVDGVPLYAAVQTAEKVSNVVTVLASGAGGHAAIPLEDNVIGRIGRAIAAIQAHREPARLLPTTREFFQGLSARWPVTSEADAMVDLVGSDPRDLERASQAAEMLCRIPTFNAVLRTGISPTVISGGAQSNVIPTKATATLSIRTLPGDSLDAVVARLQRAVNDANVHFEITHRGIDAPVTSSDTPMFAAIAASISAVAPALVTVPYLSTGATDNARLRAFGIQAYGLLPFPLVPADEGRMHGADERVPIESLLFGLEVIHGAIDRIAH